MNTQRMMVDPFWANFLNALNSSAEGSDAALKNNEKRGGESEQKSPEWKPNLDIRETEAAYEIFMEAAGMRKEDIHISFQDGRLTLSGDRKAEEPAEQRRYLRRERQSGCFERSFNFGSKVDADKITARSTNGVLSVTLPKKAEVQPRTIEIRASN